MSTPASASTGGNNARKKAAKDLSNRTGMLYTAALALVSPTEPPTPRHRWILTEEIHAFFRGEGWHGLYFEDLYRWLDSIRPTYECDWCGDDGDARREDSSLELIVARYDPDVSPQTHWLGTKKHHTRCRPSRISWAIPSFVDQGAVHTLRLPASAAPDQYGEFQVMGKPLIINSGDGQDSDGRQAQLAPALLLDARIDDEIGAVAWLYELEQMIRAHGFHESDISSPAQREPAVLTLRVEVATEKGESFAALRAEEPSMGKAPHHLYLGALDLPEQWADLARERGSVFVVFGPTVQDGYVPVFGEVTNDDELYGLYADGEALVRSVPVVFHP